MNLRLCEVLGARVVGVGKLKQAHGFPTAAKLAAVAPSVLRARCRVGYRDARIVELSKLMCTSPRHGGIDMAMLEDPATPDTRVFETLLELPGIGPYAAANIMQLLGRYARLPLDTESVRHGKNVLGMKGSPSAIMKRLGRHYAPFGPHAFRSYWFELWAWYEGRQGPAHTWERDSTGKLFTAAVLNKPAAPKGTGAGPEASAQRANNRA
jgi:3-methyladenine DNA glycosylase/8-oxoguanine DNA glycosylase